VQQIKFQRQTEKTF